MPKLTTREPRAAYFIARADKATLDELAAFAGKRGISTSDAIREAIDAWIRGHRKWRDAEHRGEYARSAVTPVLAADKNAQTGVQP